MKLFKVVATFIALVVFLGSANILSLEKPLHAQGSQYYFVLKPSQNFVAAGSTFDVTVFLEDGSNNLNSWYFSINFNKDDFALTGSNFDINTTSFDKINPSSLSSDQGYVKISGIKKLGTPSPTGEVTLGTIHFVAKSNFGEKTISFSSTDPSMATAYSSPPTPITIGSNQNATVTVVPTLQATPSYKIAESPSDLANNAQWQPFTNLDGGESAHIKYPLQSPLKIGDIRVIYVKYKSITGKESPVFQRRIKYIGPDPTIDNLSCNYDSTTGVGTKITINGENFGDQGTGNVQILAQSGSSNLNINSWSMIQGSVPTSAPTAATSPTFAVSPSPTTASAPSGTVSPSQTQSPTPTPTTAQSQQSSSNGQLAYGGSVLGDSSQPIWQISGTVSNRLEGAVRVTLTQDSSLGQRSVSKICNVNTTTVTFTAQTQCRPPGQLQQKDASAQIYENANGSSVALYNQKITLDQNGEPQGFTPKLEVGKNYSLIIKAPGTLASRVNFTAAQGTTVVPTFSLRVGDIFPSVSSDGVVNSLDLSELIREWNSLTDVTRASDFNQDNRVNSLDYSCLRANFNQSSDKFTGPS